ncbi:hypothetical protein [Streptomyces nodosus]|uniref:hypothetical protein n=1 Tax=Streptomyces nodosus TaxID=40318 RepID=UPI003818E855
MATKAFKMTQTGCEQLLVWLRSHGQVLAVGMEGTGHYGAEFACFLQVNGITVIGSGVRAPSRVS